MCIRDRAYSSKFKVTTARFANVAFSNGSLLAGFIDRIMKKQPLAAPNDVKRYFVSPEESGQICMLACILGNNGEIFFPKLGEEKMITFSSICDRFLRTLGYEKKECAKMCIRDRSRPPYRERARLLFILCRRSGAGNSRTPLFP